MKLTHPKIETIFTDSFVNILTIENREFFREIFKDLCNAVNGEDDSIVLSDNDKIINLSKCGLLIIDPINIDFLDKKANSRMLAELSELADTKYATDITKINQCFVELIEKLNASSSVKVDWFADSPIQSMFKAFRVTISDDKENDAERLINYIDMFVHFYDIKLLVFVNLKSFFAVSELQEIYKYVRYNHLLSIDLESFLYDKVDMESHIIIDNDLCEIIA